MTLVLPPPVAALETISSGGSRTVVLPMYSHDAYELQIGSGETASIGFSADSNVDFYVMTASGYAEYVDPSSPSFHILDERENAQSFSHSTTQSGLILVIDNDDVTSSGASSTVSRAARSAKVGWLRDVRKMPISTDRDFGARLRAFRERQGLTLSTRQRGGRARRGRTGACGSPGLGR